MIPAPASDWLKPSWLLNRAEAPISIIACPHRVDPLLDKLNRLFGNIKVDYYQDEYTIMVQIVNKIRFKMVYTSY